MERLEARLRELTQLHQRKVAIVGWSRGGMLGKIVALRQPELSFGLVTIVSPNLNPRAFSNRVERQLSTLLQVSQKRAISGVMKPECVYGACADRSLAELQQPLTESVPYASIYSRPDGVVNWRACLDEGARLIEVHTSHTGAGVTPRVIRLVGDELASTTARPPSGRT